MYSYYFNVHITIQHAFEILEWLFLSRDTIDILRRQLAFVRLLHVKKDFPFLFLGSQKKHSLDRVAAENALHISRKGSNLTPVKTTFLAQGLANFLCKSPNSYIF
jgi:hypothetical protein